MKNKKIQHLVYLTLPLMFLFSLPAKLTAQNDSIQVSEQFLFPEFSVGVVRMKNNEKVVLKLNYNIVTEKMVFLQKGQIFDIVNYAAIDTVYIEERKFIPQGKVFYEVLVNGPVSLFIQNKGSVRQPSRPAAYGGTSDVSSSTYISNLKLGNEVFRMKNKPEIRIIPGPIIWIRKNNEFTPVSKKTQLLKVLSDKNSEVRDYMNINRLDIENPDHIKSLITYYNGLSL
jgi:hypothetical protein